MELSALAGNAHVKAVLSQQEGGRGLSHAYILSGPAGSGRHTLARLLCGAMLCAASGGDPVVYATVSYTHLDVYTRQQQRTGRKRRQGGQLLPQTLTQTGAAQQAHGHVGAH